MLANFSFILWTNGEIPVDASDRAVKPSALFGKITSQALPSSCPSGQNAEPSGNQIWGRTLTEWETGCQRPAQRDGLGTWRSPLHMRAHRQRSRVLGPCWESGPCKFHNGDLTVHPGRDMPHKHAGGSQAKPYIQENVTITRSVRHS